MNLFRPKHFLSDQSKATTKKARNISLRTTLLDALLC
jgi:hypothetical protein